MTKVTRRAREYDQIPVYRRQWFFWLMYVVFQPVALLILITGDVYYMKRGEIRSFGVLNRLVAGVIGLLILYAIFSGARTSPGPNSPPPPPRTTHTR